MDRSAARRVTPARAAAALLAVALLAYGGVVVYLVSQETAIVFKADLPMGNLRPAAPFETVELPRPDGTRQIVWMMPAAIDPVQQDGETAGGARPWVLFLHGNGAPISARLNILHYERLRRLGLNVIAPEYRGYAGTPGVPTEAGVEADGRAAYDYLRSHLDVPPDRIVVFGWSLGSAVAVDVASRVPFAAVILEGAPSSLVDIGQMRYPYMPIRLLMRNPFESIRKIGAVHAPKLFLHSPEDTIVPIEEGRKLFAAANDPKQFVEVQGGHVYAAERDPSFFPAVAAFLRAQGLIAR